MTEDKNTGSHSMHQPERLIDWDGERCVPWTQDIQVIYEHYHRYAFATQFTAGKRVLDLASGEGYGVDLLSRNAVHAHGVDVDPTTVAHASGQYSASNVSFSVGSITDVELLAGQQFDVITCFESIEHVHEQDNVLALVEKLLAPDGLFLVSTPDTKVYREEKAIENHFHVKELSEPEFLDLVGGHFAHVELYRQNIAVGSTLVAASLHGDTLTQQLSKDGDSWTLESGAPHTFLFAAASRVALPKLPATAVMFDPDKELVATALEQGHLKGHLSRDAEVGELKAKIRTTEQLRAEAVTIAEHLATSFDELHQELKQAQDDFVQVSAESEAYPEHRVQHQATLVELATAQKKIDLLQSKVTWLEESVGDLSVQTQRLGTSNAELTAQNSALAQRLVSKYRGALEKYAPRGSKQRDAYERALGRPAGVAEVSSDLGPTAIRTSLQPVVSVVIPVHNKWAYTRKCLQALESTHPSVPYEVIIVDDASSDETASSAGTSIGVRLVQTPKNLGFVGACNLGAEKALGQFIVFLNNDTEVQSGWLDTLVDTAVSDDSIGLVGSKLIYPDGTLQECGGIIFADGSGWNYGRGENAADERFSFLRDVDYCSGAAILVRAELFTELGGFDSRYAPAYYEDTDLAFGVRKAGFRTVVQPKAVVMHHEGISNGTDLSSGLKKYQEINRSTFVTKWAVELAGHFPEATPERLWTASTRTDQAHQGGIVLVIDHQIPMPNKDSGSVRMFNILAQLTKLGRRVVFVANNGAAWQPYTEQVQQLGVRVLTRPEHHQQLLREAGQSIDFVLLSRPNVAWGWLEQLREYAPQATIAYDTVDLHFLRLSREAEVTFQQGKPEKAAALTARAKVSKELELGLIRTTDLALVVSEPERDLLAELAPDAHVEVLSNIHQEMPVTTGFPTRDGLLFVGSFDHVPNQDAVNWLITEIFPAIHKALPHAELHIIGSNPPAALTELSLPGVHIHGWVEDLEPYYAKAKFVLAPLRFGAGVKGKVGESLSHGVPVIGTKVAFEGMHIRNGHEVLQAETATEFASLVTERWTDQKSWQSLSTNGQLAIQQQFGTIQARTTLKNLLEQ